MLFASHFHSLSLSRFTTLLWAKRGVDFNVLFATLRRANQLRIVLARRHGLAPSTACPQPSPFNPPQPQGTCFQLYPTTAYALARDLVKKMDTAARK